MKKILLTATVYSHISQFHKPLIEMLQKQGMRVHIAARNNLDAKPGLVLDEPDEKFDIPFSRAPLAFSNIKAYQILKQILSNGNYNVIHCNTPMGGILTRLAARKLRKRGLKVIYTAHGFHFYKGAPILNWMVYYPIEKWMARYTDVLITINQEDYARAKQFKAVKVEYIPGIGVDVERFTVATADRDKKRNELGIPRDAIMLLSMGDLSKRKNHEVMLRALAILNNPAVHYCIAGVGDLREYLEEQSAKLGIGDNVHFLGYRRDVSELCKCTDIYCFPSRQEGLPVALMEAMASGLPCVVSNIRGNTDLFEDGKGGFMCDADNASEYASGIEKLINDSESRKAMGHCNEQAIKKFDLSNVMSLMGEIYKGVQ